MSHLRHTLQDELSAPPVEDFLPSGYTTTTTETPTAPPLPIPVDAVPAGFDQRYDNGDGEDEPEIGVEPVPLGSQVEKVAKFQNVEDVDVAAKVDTVRQVAALDDDPVAVEDEEVEEEEEQEVGDGRQVADANDDANDGHIEVHEQVVEDAVVTEEPQDLHQNRQPASQDEVEQLNPDEQVDQVQPIEQVQQLHRVRPVAQVDDVEEFKPVEKVQPVKVPMSGF